MRHSLASPLFLSLAALIVLLYPSCHPIGPITDQLPLTVTILLDFSDPNSHGNGIGGYCYLYDGESYPATYNAWATWSCTTGPDFFAAWDDTSLTVWLAHCPETLHLESTTAQTSDGTPLPIVSWTSVPEAHEPTYQLILDPINYVDIENGVTTITLNVVYN